MRRTKELLDVLKQNMKDYDEVATTLLNDERYGVIATVGGLVHKLIKNNQCSKCRMLMSAGDIVELVPAVLEDPVMTMVYVCSNCGKIHVYCHDAGGESIDEEG